METKLFLSKWQAVALIILCVAFAACAKISTNDAGRDWQASCPQGHYWPSSACRPCHGCVDRQLQLSMCTEDTVCLTRQEYKIGMQCLRHHRIRHLKRLLRTKKSWKVLGPNGEGQLLCLSLQSRLVRLLYTKSGTLKTMSKERLKHGKSIMRRLKASSYHEEHRRSIVKRETTATEIVTESSLLSTTTEIPMYASNSDLGNDLYWQDALSNRFSRKNSKSSNGHRVRGQKGRRKNIVNVPKGNDGKGRQHSDDAQTPKESSNDMFSSPNKQSKFPVSSSDLDSISDDQDLQRSGGGGDIHSIASGGSRESSSGGKQNKGNGSQKISAPTFPPTGSNTREKGDGDLLGVSNVGPGFDSDGKKSVNSISDGHEDSSSSSSSWFDNSEWLYSFLGAAVLILAVSVFIASRLKLRRNKPVSQSMKMVQVCSEDTSGEGNANGDGHEMGGVDDSVFKIPTTTTGECAIRNLSVSYQSDTNLAEIKKFSLTHSHSSNLETKAKSCGGDEWIKALKSTASLPRMDWLAKTSDINAQNDYSSYHSEAETQTDGETVSHNSKTVFDTPWQFSGMFSREGGVLQRDNSDVTLVVGREAVAPGKYVHIQGSIFTDASEIRRKFGLPSNEMLITPLVEYHAEGSYHFQQHVSVKLPHALPDNFDDSFIKFYTFSVDDCGNVKLESLPLKSKDNNILDDTDAFWEISQGRFFIAKTKHFSGYFCTTCESKSKPPSIYARVFGSHIQIKSSRREVRLILYLWDRRLNIKDFIQALRQQECDMDRQLLADEPVPLLENASSDSSIVMRMETLGDPDDQLLWKHVSRSNASRPLFRPLQVRKLRQIVLCCQQSDPMRVEWAMENVSGATLPSSVFQCLIEMVHVPEGITDYQEAFTEAEEEYIRTFYVRNLKLAQSDESKKEEDVPSRQDLLKKTVSSIVDRRDMECICQAFGLNQKDIGNISRKFDSDDALKTGLLEECSRKCGLDNFLQVLPHVLQQTQLLHVIEHLQDTNLLSAGSSCKQGGCGSSSRDVASQQQQGRCLRQLSEDTVCKSLSRGDIDLESIQRQSNQQHYLPSDVTSDFNNYSVSEGGGRGGIVHNQLRVHINPKNVPSRINLDEGTQVSPDSDYGSPSCVPQRDGIINNARGNVPEFPLVNCTPLFSCDSNNTSNSPYTCSNNNIFNNVNHVQNGINTRTTPSPSSKSYNNSTTSNINNTSVSQNGFYPSSNNNSNSSHYSVSDSDYDDDSCLATIDSNDLKDVERIQTDNSMTLTDYSGDQTSKKELAVKNCSGHQTSKKELTVLAHECESKDDCCVAYPEIPEEKYVSRSGPGANLRGTVGNHEKRSGKSKSSKPNTAQSHDGEGDTFVKETFI